MNRTLVVVLALIFLLLSAYLFDLIASAMVFIGAALSSFFEVSFTRLKPMRAVAVTVLSMLITGLILAAIFILMLGLRGEEED